MTPPIVFSPLIVGVMRLGVWGAKMTTSELETFIDQCLDLGLRDFDHADIYGHYTSETEFGAVLKKRPDLRNKLQITTKCSIKLVCDNRPEHRIQSYDSTPKHILASVENSLRDLQVDALDLLLLHRPDFLLNPHEVAEVFEQLKKAGKVKHFGVSNYTPAQFAMLHSFTPLVNNQIEVSLLHLDPFSDGTLAQCLQHQIIPTAWSPLGGGLLFTDVDNPRVKRVLAVAQPLAEKYNAGIDQIMLAFIQKHPAGIIPVLGTSKINRIESALKAQDIQMSHEEWYDLYQASTGEQVP